MANASFTQQQRPFRLHTTLGSDFLLLTALHGEERLSHLFDFSIEALLPIERDAQFRRGELLGSPAAIEFHDPANDASSRPVRHLHGIIAEVRREAIGTQFSRYRLRLVPRPYLMTLNSVCRTYHGMDVVEIVKSVFAKYEGPFYAGFEFVPTRLQRDRFFKFDCCIQFEESDFAFVSRLLEESGIYYYFEHEADKHRMVLGDSHNYADLHPKEPLRYRQTSGTPWRRISAWSEASRLVPAQFAVLDHCFQEKPRQAHEAVQQCATAVAAENRNTRLDWNSGMGEPAGRKIDFSDARVASRFDAIAASGAPSNQDIAEGVDGLARRKARDRAERALLEAAEVDGQSDYGHLAPGYTFSLDSESPVSGRYLIERVRHHVRLPGFIADDLPAEPYGNEFSCLPAELTFRPERRTPRPNVTGLQTATVVGVQSNESSPDEIFTDPYGRVKVRFHWMAEGTTTGWLRVVYPWAGKNWGSLMLPRQGQEVAVAFRNGDVDAPFVLGSLYNVEHPVPFNLPAERALAGFRSRTKGGEPDQASQLVFCDQPGDEYVQVHSERDMHLASQRDSFVNVGGNHSIRVGFDVPPDASLVGAATSGSGGSSGETDNSYGNLNVSVSNDYTLDVGGDQNTTVTGDCNVTVTGSTNVTVNQDGFWTMGGSYAALNRGACLFVCEGFYGWSVLGAEVDLFGGNYTCIIVGLGLELTVGGQASFEFGLFDIDVHANLIGVGWSPNPWLNFGGDAVNAVVLDTFACMMAANMKTGESNFIATSKSVFGMERNMVGLLNNGGLIVEQ